ncbi:hypothetical protein, partial [Vibrio rotiferianus]|uniref:hypothetical protein n=1 Tax=Vibrio rotiferianus TaxID=190895 RepID=UPI001C3194F0
AFMLGFFFSRLTLSQLLALNCSLDDVGRLLVLLISSAYTPLMHFSARQIHIVANPLALGLLLL